MEKYAYIWEYVVNPQYLETFVAHYNQNGTWVELFRKGKGFLFTELLHDKEKPNRFVTIDHWESYNHYILFKRKYSIKYDELDKLCQKLTFHEKKIGEFSY